MKRSDARMRKRFTMIGRDHCRMPYPQSFVNMPRANTVALAAIASEHRIKTFDRTPRLIKTIKYANNPALRASE